MNIENVVPQRIGKTGNIIISRRIDIDTDDINRRVAEDIRHQQNEISIIDDEIYALRVKNK